MKATVGLFFLALSLPGCNSDDDPETMFIYPDKRAHHALVYDLEKKVVVMTGGSTPLNGGQSFKFFNDIWHYNSAQWAEIGTAGDQRSGIALAYDLKRNMIYSYGGFRNNTSLADLRVLDGDTWIELSNNSEMQAAEGGLVYDADRDRLVAFGGSSVMQTINNTTWEWDGTSWSKFTGPGPEGRQSFAFVYDTQRKKTILYGGMGATPQTLYGDVWEFDGTAWTQVTSGDGPGSRMAVGYAYDSKRGMMIIFGGADSQGFLGDTWGWNGSTWIKLAESGPAARIMGYMAYDTDRDRIVLFGGRLGWPEDANDTWEWDGNIWTEIK